MRNGEGNQRAPAGDRVKIALLSVLILAALGTAAFLFFSPGVERHEPVTTVLTDHGPDLFRLPGDFEHQDIMFLAGGPLADRHPELLTRLVRSLGTDIAIRLLHDPSAGLSPLTSILADPALDDHDLQAVPLPVRSVWIRDFGPRTVSDDLGRRSMVEFAHHDRRHQARDAKLAAQLAVALDLNLMGGRLSLEGGDLIGNGRGFGLISEAMVARNAADLGFGRDDVLQNVASLLGIENLTVVPPLEGEPTGHVDLFCAFLAPDLVVVGQYAKDADPANATRLDATADFLAGLTTRAGRLRVERLPMPDHEDGAWRTYTAIVFANEMVLVPQFPAYCPDLDAKALAFYRRLLPARRIVGVAIDDLAAQNTSLRRLTLNVPAGTATADPNQPPSP